MPKIETKIGSGLGLNKGAQQFSNALLKDEDFEDDEFPHPQQYQYNNRAMKEDDFAFDDDLLESEMN